MLHVSVFLMDHHQAQKNFKIQQRLQVNIWSFTNSQILQSYFNLNIKLVLNCKYLILPCIFYMFKIAAVKLWKLLEFLFFSLHFWALKNQIFNFSWYVYLFVNVVYSWLTVCSVSNLTGIQ